MTRIRRRGRSRGAYNAGQDPDAGALARKLREARIDASLTQAALAAGLGVGRPTLAMYERGDRPFPARLLGPLNIALPASVGWAVEAYYPAVRGTRQQALRLKSPEVDG